MTCRTTPWRSWCGLFGIVTVGEKRGGEAWGKPPLKDHCCVCKYVTEWAMDLLWKKWEHDSFVPFGVFVNNLINTDMYDFHMGKVSTGQMPVLRFFLPVCFARPQRRTIY